VIIGNPSTNFNAKQSTYASQFTGRLFSWLILGAITNINSNFPQINQKTILKRYLWRKNLFLYIFRGLTVAMIGMTAVFRHCYSHQLFLTLKRYTRKKPGKSHNFGLK
jgi:hypothetical protein